MTESNCKLQVAFQSKGPLNWRVNKSKMNPKGGDNPKENVLGRNRYCRQKKNWNMINMITENTEENV